MSEDNQKRTEKDSPQPQPSEDFIEIRKDIPSPEEMFKAGVHFGHKTSKWNPKMGPYIFSTHNDIHILNLEKTAELLEKAVDFLKEVAQKGGQILFIGTKPSSRLAIESAAKICQMPYVSERWPGGLLTNYKTIRKRLEYLHELEQKSQSSDFKKYTKKERTMIEKQIAKMRHRFGGLVQMMELPQALFVVDVKENSTAVREAGRKKIPLVGMVDTNSAPTLIDYPIPSNDDAVSSVKLILGVVAGHIKEGQSKQKSKIPGLAKRSPAMPTGRQAAAGRGGAGKTKNV